VALYRRPPETEQRQNNKKMKKEERQKKERKKEEEKKKRFAVKVSFFFPLALIGRKSFLAARNCVCVYKLELGMLVRACTPQNGTDTSAYFMHY